MGYYDGNPFHEVAKEAARMVNAGFMLNVVQDPHKNIVGAVAGNLEKDMPLEWNFAGKKISLMCMDVRI